MMDYKNSYTRRFSLEEDFMNFDTNDLLFGFMQYLATYHPKEKKLYLTKVKFQENKKVITSICGYKSRNTLLNNIKKLMDKGLVQEEEIDVGGIPYTSYVFPYDYDTAYQIINNELLWYIISTRNIQSIKVYAYLLNKYNWKNQEGKEYQFSIQEIKEKLGYAASTTTADSLIANILESFAREGIISYVDTFEQRILPNGTVVPMPKKILKFVAINKNELNQI